MTYYNNSHNIIESDDIQDVLGAHVTSEQDGTKTVTVKFSLDPRKNFEAAEELFFHLTNGINHRTVGPVTPVQDPSELNPPAQSVPISTSTAPESSTSTEQSTEATQESEAVPTEPVASTESTESPTTSDETSTEAPPTTTTEG